MQTDGGVFHCHARRRWAVPARIAAPAAGIVLLLGLGGAAEADDPVLRPGDRVALVGNAYADQLRVEGYLETLLTVRRPDLQLTFRNLGWSGDTVTHRPRPLNFGSLEDHLRAAQADVVLLCFGMSESLDDPAGGAAFADALGALIDRIDSQLQNDGRTSPRIVLVSPIAHEPGALGDDELAATHNQALREYVAAMHRVAVARSLPLVDLFSFTSELIAEEGPRLTKNGIHPTAYGYWATAWKTADALIGPVGGPEIEVDVSAGDGAADEDVPAAAGASAAQPIRLKRDRLPDPAPPETPVHPSLRPRLPVVKIRGLPFGDYQLVLDDRPLVQADAAEWRYGRTVPAAELARPTEEVRQRIRQKNEWFFFRWRPANAEYVFGRRAKPFGVVSFPPEMEQFDRLIDASEREIQRQAKASWETRAVLRRVP